MKLQLPDSVSSPQDVKALTYEIRQYARWFAHSSIKNRLSAGKIGDPPTLSPAAVAVIESVGNQKQLDQANLDELISSLEYFAATAPHLTITLAAAAPNSLKKTLLSWCREHIAPDVLVSFRFNSTILGGMVIRYGSHVFDWSFRRQILASRSHFPEVLRRV